MKELDFTEQELDMAKAAAVLAARRWSMVSEDDVIGELYWWLCDQYKYVKRYRSEGDSGRYKLAASLRRAAHTYCAKEQRAGTGGRKEDVQHYTLEGVKHALPYAFSPEDWPQSTVIQVPHTGQVLDVVDSGDSLAVLSDINSALLGLPKADQDTLALRFRLDYSYGQIGSLLQITEDAARKRTDRALSRLMDRLSGVPPW